MKAILNILLKLLVSAGLLFYLISQVPLNGFEDAFSETVPLFFLLAVGFFVISNGLGACQWYFLLRAQKFQIKFGQAMIAYWIGVFFNNVLLGNIGGDALRIYDVRRLTGDLRGAAAYSFAATKAWFFWDYFPCHLLCNLHVFSYTGPQGSLSVCKYHSSISSDFSPLPQ